ncbi:autotransporter domain-containing protein [Burkholderia sp. ABCPW 111]|uniref:autotransporter domain-containing protein n=1 Tax=Burkholderia sp. ABCPW 111 TaxID=1820025 RepID=UPI000530DA47|nr:autotransporter domain-containing protein [Burkholderia sp. ABCPW 111]KGR96197.1 outer membrane autotransporter barrel domain protein [Burkholderia sp. ABCPW 111]
MNCTRSRKNSELAKLVPSMGVFVALVGAGIVQAHAACTPAGTTVTCSGAANLLAPSYSNSGNNLNVTVDSGASLGVLLGIGGTALSLTGSGVSLTNNGTIDPTVLGSGLGVLSSGTVVGNASPSTTNVTNNGTMNGTTGVSISGLTGMALAVQNGTGGVSNITNTGTIGSTPLVGATLLGPDSPVVAAYGGGQVNFNNSGTITGRVAFQPNGAAGQGNTFVNSGTIDGSVSMGSNSTNTFTAMTGSTVSAAGGTGVALNIGVGSLTLGFAATGIVDGGAGGNNTLLLQQAAGGPASGTIAVNNYINFNHLDVTSGAWTINGASSAQDATLSGGVAIIGNNASLGTGTITGNGGALQAGAAGLDVSNNVTLGAGGLTVQGATGLTLSGAISGGGALTKNGGGTLTLTGANTYTGGTTINAGTLALGAGGSLAATGAVNLAGAGAGFDISGATGSQTIGGLSGVAGTTVALGGNGLTLAGSGGTTFGGTIGGTGGLTLAGTGTQTLTGANTYTGGTTINAGTLALGAGGSLAAAGAVTLGGAGATFDISGSGANQTIGALSGAGGTIALDGNTLAFGTATNQTFGGSITGTGGIVKNGAGTQTLTGANTYTGGTTVNAGTLALGAGGSLSPSGAVNLANAGAGFDLSGASGSQTIGGLSGAAGTTVTLGGNSLTLAGSGNATFGGTIGGTGGLTLAGTGTQALTGSNTYSGGTTLAGGTVALGGSGALGTGAVTVAAPTTIAATAAVNLSNAVALNSTATIGGTRSLMLSGPVSGAGGLVMNGSSTLTLVGANTYAGGTTVDAGTVVVGNGGALGTGGLTVNGGSVSLGGSNVTLPTLNGAAGGTIDTGAGSLAVTGGGSFGGALTGGGSLAVSGGAPLTLTGANTFTGGTTIASGGTLQIGNGGTTGSLAGNVADNGALVFDEAANVTYGGAISGSGSLTQAGSGVLTLTGASTLAGPTTVAAGTLAVDGSLANSTVSVRNGATVTGTGTLGGLVVASGGTASLPQPGQVLNVAGNVTFQAGSTLQVAANPQQSGSLAATGSATLNGGTVQVLASQANYQANTTYTILSAGAGVQGQFAGVNATYAFVTPTLAYDANHVFLRLAPNATPFTSVAATQNQTAAAGALGTLGAGNPLFDTVLVTDAPTARSAFSQLDGELQASMKSMLLTDSRYVRDAVTDRVRQGLAPGSGPLAALSSGGAALCDDAGGGAPRQDATPPERRLGSRESCVGGTPYRPVVWGQAFGGRSRLASDGNASTLNRSMTGFIAGADVALNDRWRAGAAAGLTHSSLDNDLNSSASLNSYYVALYGGAQYGAWGVRGGAVYTWYRIDTDRSPAFAAFRDHDSAGYDANSGQVFGEVGYAIPVGRFALEPFAGLAYVSLHTDGYQESGGAAALKGDADTSNVAFSTLGVRAATELGVLAKGTLSARAMAGWRHAFGSARPTSTLAFAAGGSSFQVAGVPIARDSAVLELGIDASVTKNLTLGVSYSGQYGSGVRDNAVLGNALWRF